MTTTLKPETMHGIDLSHHQNPIAVDWKDVAKHVDFCVVRATYGTMVDKKAVEHVKRLRAAGCIVGLYHFFRPSQDWMAQLASFEAVASKVGLGPGDIVPAIDIEDDPLPTRQVVSPAWGGPCQALASALEHLFGGVMVYITQRDWTLLGRPQWVTKCPLWVAHWRARGQPRWPALRPSTPGGAPCAIHQYAVGPGLTREGIQDHKAPGALDHNLAVALPLIPPPGQDPAPVIDLATTIEAQVAEVMEMDWNEFRSARDRIIAAKDDD